VNFSRGVLDKLSDEQVLQKLKLIKKVSENYTGIDRDLRVKTFKNINEIFEYYYDIKLEYLQKRKDHLINKITSDIKFDVSKYLFIKAITEDQLIINKRKKIDIEKDLNEEKFDKIITRDSNYDYLLGMSISSLTIERMNKLMADIKAKKVELDKIKSQTLEMMWTEDLK